MRNSSRYGKLSNTTLTEAQVNLLNEESANFSGLRLGFFY